MVEGGPERLLAHRSGLDYVLPTARKRRASGSGGAGADGVSEEEAQRIKYQRYYGASAHAALSSMTGNYKLAEFKTGTLGRIRNVRPNMRVTRVSRNLKGEMVLNHDSRGAGANTVAHKGFGVQPRRARRMERKRRRDRRSLVQQRRQQQQRGHNRTQRRGGGASPSLAPLWAQGGGGGGSPGSVAQSPRYSVASRSVLGEEALEHERAHSELDALLGTRGTAGGVTAATAAAQAAAMRHFEGVPELKLAGHNPTWRHNYSNDYGTPVHNVELARAKGTSRSRASSTALQGGDKLRAARLGVRRRVRRAMHGPSVPRNTKLLARNRVLGLRSATSPPDRSMSPSDEPASEAAGEEGGDVTLPPSSSVPALGTVQPQGWRSPMRSSASTSVLQGSMAPVGPRHGAAAGRRSMALQGGSIGRARAQARAELAAARAAEANQSRRLTFSRLQARIKSEAQAKEPLQDESETTAIQAKVQNLCAMLLLAVHQP